MSTSTLYALPPGSHSVSARGQEFVANERGEIDLLHVDSDVVSDLMAYAGVKHVPNDEERKAATEAYAEYERHRQAVADQARAAHEDSGAADRARLAEDERAALAVQETQQADADDAAQRAAFIAAAPVEEVSASDEAASTTGPEIDPNSRSVTPPRRKKA